MTTERQGGFFPCVGSWFGGSLPRSCSRTSSLVQTSSPLARPFKRGSSRWQSSHLEPFSWVLPALMDSKWLVRSKITSILIRIEERSSPALNSTFWKHLVALFHACHVGSWVIASHCGHSQSGCSDALVRVGGVLLQPSQFLCCLIQLWWPVGFSVPLLQKLRCVQFLFAFQHHNAVELCLKMTSGTAVEKLNPWHIFKPCIFYHSQGFTAQNSPFWEWTWECWLTLVLKPVICSYPWPGLLALTATEVSELAAACFPLKWRRRVEAIRRYANWVHVLNQEIMHWQMILLFK